MEIFKIQIKNANNLLDILNVIDFLKQFKSLAFIKRISLKLKTTKDIYVGAGLSPYWIFLFLFFFFLD